MKDRIALEALINRLVAVDGFSSRQTLLPHPAPSDLDLKIALLSLILEELRYERNAEVEPVTFEKYVRCDVFTDDEKIVIVAPQKYEDIGSSTTRVQLQSALLLFLLIHHRARYSVLEIIQLFIEKIRSQLTFLDFKKTKTGPTRCYTNTLRDYGLLKFTHREAFKTWELSLTGFLVAASMLRARKQASALLWTLAPPNKENHFDILPEIRNACDDIGSYDVFVERLASVCKPKAEVFQTFQPALLKAYEILEDYWATLKNSDLTQKARKEASQQSIKRLEQGGIGDQFYVEFSKCLRGFDEPEIT
jgi:hypothetical protein